MALEAPCPAGQSGAQNTAVLAAAALVANAFIWGVSWWPLRQLQDFGLHPLWSTALVYLLGMCKLSMSRFWGTGEMQCKALGAQCGKPHKRGTTQQCARQCRHKRDIWHFRLPKLGTWNSTAKALKKLTRAPDFRLSIAAD